MEKKDYVGEQDVIGKEIIAKQLKAIEDEIPMYERAIVNVKEQIKNFSEQFELDKKIYKIMLANFERVPENATWKFEQDKEYIALQKKKQEYKVREDKYKGEAKLLELNAQLSKFETELDTAFEQRDKLGEN